MSDHEQFAEVAQRKWAIVSELLILLTKNERMSESLIFFSKSLIRSFLYKKRAIRSEIKWAKFPALYYIKRKVDISFDMPPFWATVKAKGEQKRSLLKTKQNSHFWKS